jgi:hypothetical protein
MRRILPNVRKGNTYCIVSIILRTTKVVSELRIWMQLSAYSEFKNPRGVPSKSPICQMVVGAASAELMLAVMVPPAEIVTEEVATASSLLYTVDLIH